MIIGKFFIITYLLMIVAQLIEDLMLTLKFYSAPTHILSSFFESSKGISSSGSSLKMILLPSLLAAPILEEFQFRLLLKKYNGVLISISLSLIAGLFLYEILSSYLWLESEGMILGLFPTLYNLFFGVLFFFPIRILVHRISADVWNGNSKLIFYFSALLFSLIHITNYQMEPVHYLFMPIILLPYFIYALVFGFIRIRLGIFYSIILHSLFLIPKFIQLITK